MTVPSVGGVGGLDQLAQLYRQQVLTGTAGTGTDVAASAAVAAATGTDPAAAARGTDFASAIGDGLRGLENLDATARTQAVRAATGDLDEVQDYVIAANKVQFATELTTTVRNKALESFNEIMRMPL
ncbi:MAG: flagellar hook-basal body complex protein FliE [Kineosporiaceae bacterium]|jgi:flagellar hook-basal body complex protein FliE